MQHSEFLEWLARDRVEPIGDRRSELHNAMLMSLLSYLHAKKGKGADEFIIDFWGDSKPATLADKFLALQGALGQSGNNGNDTRNASN